MKVTDYAKYRKNIVKQDKKDLEEILNEKVHSAIIEDRNTVVYVYLTYGSTSISQLRLTIIMNNLHSLDGDVKYYPELERITDLVNEILSR